MTTFWILWIFNALMALIPLYFFFIGIGDGSITSRNIGLWMIILLIVAVVVGGSLLLKSANQMGLAKALLMVAAIPGLLAILYFAVVMTSKTRWN